MPIDWKEYAKVICSVLPLDGLEAMVEAAQLRMVGAVGAQAPTVGAVGARVGACGHCGAAFDTTSERAVFCSKSCREMAYRKRKSAVGTGMSVGARVGARVGAAVGANGLGGGGVIPSEPKAKKDSGRKAAAQQQRDLIADVDRARHPAELFPMPENLAADREFIEAWEEWVECRKQKRKPVTAIARKAQLKMLSQIGPARAIAAIRHSTASDYQAVVEPPMRKDVGAGAAKPDVREKLNAAKRRDMDA